MTGELTGPAVSGAEATQSTAPALRFSRLRRLRSRHGRPAVFILVFWAIEILYSSAQLVYRTSFTQKPWSWPSALTSEFVYGYMGALLTPGILWLARKYPIERRFWLRRIVLHVGAASIFAAVLKLHWDLMGFPAQPAYLTGEFSWTLLLRSMLWAFDAGFCFYWGILLAILTADYYHRYQASRVHAVQLHTQLVQAQLQTLRMQLNPHFLFNTLNSISELVHEDSEAADRMIARLSELLRCSLESTSQEVSLREELDVLGLYLEIERARFDERLAVDYRIPRGLESALVPSLILQPLAENAIRHGIARRVSGGRIVISAEHSGSDLLIRVSDNGAGLTDVPPREGVGLSTVRGRLERMYGGTGRLCLTPGNPGVEASILIPLRAAAQAIATGAYAAH